MQQVERQDPSFCAFYDPTTGRCYWSASLNFDKGITPPSLARLEGLNNLCETNVSLDALIANAQKNCTEYLEPKL